MASLATQLDFALNAAWQAGRISLSYFQTQVEVETKSDKSPVTVADKSAEQRIRALIEQYYPDDGIIGEEFGARQGKTNYSWIIDPIDGTRSFVAGVPLYATLIALVENNSPVVGVAHFPALNETIYASRSGGCYWDGRRTRVTRVAALKDATLLGSDVRVADKKSAAWQRLIAATGMQRTWGDAYGYSLVATGRAEVMVDSVMKVWDCAPFGVIMEEAGGTFTDWRGRATIHGGESIATNGLLYTQVMQALKEPI